MIDGDLEPVSASSTPCAICGARAAHAFRTTVLHRHNVDFFQCYECGFLQTPHPHWLDEAYADPIAVADTGIVLRNTVLSQIISLLLLVYFPRHGKYLDVAGGYGLFVRMMRDAGFDFSWSDSYCENLFARGFEYSAADRVDAITAIEVIEHVPNPLQFIRGALESSGSDSIILTTELFSGSAPLPGTWWYYAFEAGQHVSFYQHRTIEVVARVLGKRLYSNGSIHMLTSRRINRFAFLMMTNGRLAKTLSFLPKMLMKSRTVSDHLALIGRQRQT